MPSYHELSRGQRMHNRHEKALARKEHREPNLIGVYFRPHEKRDRFYLLSEQIKAKK